MIGIKQIGIQKCQLGTKLWNYIKQNFYNGFIKGSIFEPKQEETKLIIEESEIPKQKELVSSGYSNDLVEDIKKSEGFRSRAYRDSNGNWTIGYGTKINPITGKNIKKGDIIDEETAQKFITKSLDSYTQHIKNRGLRLPQHQMDVVYDLVYNTGPGNMNKSGIYPLLKNNLTDTLGITEKIMNYNIRNTKTSQIEPGLVNRRRNQVQRFFQYK